MCEAGRRNLHFDFILDLNTEDCCVMYSLCTE